MTARSPRTSPAPGYSVVLAEVTGRIASARHRALFAVNAELVGLYWEIGRIIVRQQEAARWGDAVVERLSDDVRSAYPDMRGLSRDNMFRMRQFFLACRETGRWLHAERRGKKVGTPIRQSVSDPEIVGTASRLFTPRELAGLVLRVSWSHHCVILGGVRAPSERYFYTAMAVRERWSVRELRRQIDAGLFIRYMSVRRNPEKCLPGKAERGGLLPFKDHYILEFLGLSVDHSEWQLRKAILANLRDFFLEFGRDFTLVGEEYPLTVGAETFRIDLLLFHRRLQCLVAVDLKIGGFKPEYIGKSLFYTAALDERLRLPHEKPAVGLVLCRSADRFQLRLALSTAAKKVGVATYQTALPDERQIRERLARLSVASEGSS
jgi:predicted nuclease of restriction endonuclease-like (RecB) superfamily